jgi:hypothetical protein
MKQVLTSAGLLALGAASLYGLDPEMTRQQSGGPFSLSATVRGFYDDNIVTSSDGAEQESFGFQFSPAVHVNLPFEQTFLSFGYIYTYTWYEERQPRNYDQAHEFNAKFRHQFSPRQRIGVNDSFIITSEPTVADRSQRIITVPTVLAGRTKNNVYHNYGVIDYDLGLTRTLALSLGYGNHWYDYEAPGEGSRSALLDRLEHTIRADLRYQFTPKVVGVVGYNLGLSHFTGDEVIARGTSSGRPVILESDDRNSVSHRVYVGTDYDLTAKLRLSARVGAQYYDYDLGESSFSPYADLSASYALRPGTAIEAGVLHSRNATDISSIDGEGRPTMDAETTALYAQFTHRITHSLSGSLNAQYQHSTYEFGENDGDTEDLWLFGANLSYTFNRHFSAEIGYTYDLLDSNLTSGDRDYDRNRVYVGLTARY